MENKELNKKNELNNVFEEIKSLLKKLFSSNLLGIFKENISSNTAYILLTFSAIIFSVLGSISISMIAFVISRGLFGFSFGTYFGIFVTTILIFGLSVLSILCFSKFAKFDHVNINETVKFLAILLLPITVVLLISIVLSPIPLIGSIIGLPLIFAGIVLTFILLYVGFEEYFNVSIRDQIIVFICSLVAFILLSMIVYRILITTAANLEMARFQNNLQNSINNLFR